MSPPGDKPKQKARAGARSRTPEAKERRRARESPPRSPALHSDSDSESEQSEVSHESDPSVEPVEPPPVPPRVAPSPCTHGRLVALTLVLVAFAALVAGRLFLRYCMDGDAVQDDFEFTLGNAKLDSALVRHLRPFARAAYLGFDAKAASLQVETTAALRDDVVRNLELCVAACASRRRGG